MEGFICIDKPKGISSFKAMSRFRRLCAANKAGHCGTLDPMATGVLVIGFGSATKLIPYIPGEPKVYTFTVQFGCETDTLDAEGEVTTEGARIPSREELSALIPAFTGTYEQRPPDYSAVKVDGVRAYRRARKKDAMQIRKKPVHIASLSLYHFDETTGKAVFMCRCSTGTYIRALVRDMAYYLDTYAYTTSMRRVRVGRFGLDVAYPISTPSRDIRPIAYARIFAGFPGVVLSSRQVRMVRQGRDIALSAAQRHPGGVRSGTDMAVHAGEDVPVCAYDEHNTLIAMMQRSAAGVLHPHRVCTPGG